MHLYPSIDLRGGKVVRLYQGAYDKQITYGDDPVGQACCFEEAGATWLHVVDLDGARSGEMAHREVIERICRETSLRVQVGGGIRSERVITDLFSSGVRRSVVGTAALREWDWFASLVAQPGYHDCIVLGLDARHGKLALSGWEKQTQTEAITIAQRVSGWPLAAIVYTDITTDATMMGPNLEATRRIAHATEVPVIASGGVGSLEHLAALRKLPIGGAIVGRSLYEKAFTIEQAISVFERSETEEPK